MSKVYISIQEADFSVDEEYDRIKQSSQTSGAIVNFIGIVRDKNAQQADVKQMELSTYVELAEKQIEKITQAALKQFDIESVSVIHRYGSLNSDDQIVFVAVSSPHRKAAFHAADMIMDHLKSSVAFWKKEISSSHDSSSNNSNKSESTWIEPKAEDLEAVKQWQKP